jgi:hypothetical protein
MCHTALNTWQSIATIASVPLLAGYVIFTILTFRQIKIQTDVQIQPFMTVVPMMDKPSTLTAGSAVFSTALFFSQTVLAPWSASPAASGPEVIPIGPEAEELLKSWETAVKTAYQKGLPDQRESFITLRLKNRGKSAIQEWSLKIELKVTPSPYLTKVVRTEPEERTFTISSPRDSDAIEPENEVLVRIVDIRYLPKVHLTWEITYKDVHGLKPSHPESKRQYERMNPFLWEYSPPSQT